MFSKGPDHATPTASATGTDRRTIARTAPKTIQPTSPAKTVPKSCAAWPTPSAENHADVGTSCHRAATNDAPNVNTSATARTQASTTSIPTNLPTTSRTRCGSWSDHERNVPVVNSPPQSAIAVTNARSAAKPAP